MRGIRCHVPFVFAYIRLVSSFTHKFTWSSNIVSYFRLLDCIVIRALCFLTHLQHGNPTIVTRSARLLLNEQRAPIPAHRARNPRFYFVHARIAGTKPRFLTKKMQQKSGIPCSASTYANDLKEIRAILVRHTAPRGGDN
jgi:hypothetical protein